MSKVFRIWLSVENLSEWNVYHHSHISLYMYCNPQATPLGITEYGAPKGPATRCDAAHLRWGVPKLLRCKNITCDALRCKFLHVQYFAPDYRISQLIIIRI